MSQDITAKPLSELIVELGSAMQEAGLWSGVAPSAQAMSSQMPFCCDTLKFEQWLQFLFIPRMRKLLESGQPLPTQSAILPMAEEMLNKSACITVVLKVIADIDTFVNRGNTTETSQ